MPAAFSPCASVAPTATAAAFFAHPASSTPTGSSETSQTTPARWKTPAQRWASASECEAQTRPAPSVAISRACAGPPMHATRSGPNTASSASVGGVPVGRDEPLGERHDSGVARDALPLELRQRLRQSLRRNGEEDEIRTVELVGMRAESRGPSAPAAAARPAGSARSRRARPAQRPARPIGTGASSGHPRVRGAARRPYRRNPLPPPMRAPAARYPSDAPLSCAGMRALRSKRIAYVIALSASAVVIGCGGDDGDDVNNNADNYEGTEAEVASVVDDFANAGRDGEGETICSEIFTAELTREHRARGRAELRQRGSGEPRRGRVRAGDRLAQGRRGRGDGCGHRPGRQQLGAALRARRRRVAHRAGNSRAVTGFRSAD